IIAIRTADLKGVHQALNADSRRLLAVTDSPVDQLHSRLRRSATTGEHRRRSHSRGQRKTAYTVAAAALWLPPAASRCPDWCGWRGGVESTGCARAGLTEAG